jgi:hypothetical protein
MDEQQAIVQRIFTRAAEKMGSVAALALHIRATYSEIRTYIAGEAMPPEDLLLRAVDLLIDELPVLRSHFSKAAWQSLALPMH